MKKLLIASALVAAGSFCLHDISAGHGGTYRGPGDTVPPGGGGGGGAPGAPGAGGPASPGPGGPGTPGPAGPGAPLGGGPAGPTTSGGGAGGPDLTLWQFWWGFNREPYLNLRAAIHSGSTLTGSDGFYLGRGEKEQSRDSLRPSEQVIRGKVVPALLNALKSERSNDILSGALVALAKIGDAKTEGGESKSQMAEAIKSRLTDGSQEIQETAAIALGILANEANIPLLAALLANDTAGLRAEGISYNGAVPERTRAFAAFGLGLVGYKATDEGKLAIVDSLVGMLDGEAAGKSMGQRDIPVACLTALGLTPLPEDAAAAPVDVSDSFPKPEQVTNRQEQILWLMNYYQDDLNNEFLNRAQVPIAVARLLEGADNDSWLRIKVAERFLADIGKHSKAQNEIVQSCVLGLGQIGDCDGDKIDAAIREGLMAVTEDRSDIQARFFSLISLGQVCGRPGSGEGSPTAGLEGRKTPRSFLMERLSKGKGGTREWAGLALAVMERALDDANQPSSLDAKSALRKALAEAKSPPEVGAMAIAVGITRDEQAKDVMREKFEKISDPEARGNTAIGLGLMNDRGSIEAITAVLRKSKYQADLLKSAAIGLGLLGDKEIVSELIEMLNDATGLSSQAALSSALGFIGDARSIDPLISLLEDKQKTDNARGFAAVALGIVADKEMLPWNAKISVNINYRANTVTLTSPSLGTGILDIL